MRVTIYLIYQIYQIICSGVAMKSAAALAAAFYGESMENSSSLEAAQLLDVTEAASFLRISPRTVYTMVAQRRIPFRKVGRRVVFLRAELMDWTLPTDR